MKNFLSNLFFFLLIPTIAFAQCEVTVDGYCHLDAEIILYNGTPAPATSNSGQGVMYFDQTSGTFQCSEDGGAFADCVGGGGTSIVWDIVANLPGSPSTNDLAGVTDGADESDCTVGTGTDQNICVYSGSAWVIIGDGTAAAASGDSVTVNSVGVDTTANFLDNTVIEFDIADGGPGGPDDVTGTIAANGVDDTHIDWGVGANQVSAADVPIALGGGTPTVDQLQEYIDNIGSSGFFLGGEVTDGGSGTVDVAAGSGFIRTTNDENAQLESFKWSASAGIAITDDTTQYVYVDDSGVISLNTSEFLEAPDKILLGLVTDEAGVTVNAYNLGVRLQEAIGQAGRFMRHVHGISKNERVGGFAFGQSEDANREVTMTAGQLEWGRTSYVISSFDTSGADTFDGYSSGGKEDTGISAWPNDSYDNAGTLTVMNTGRWAAIYWYLEPDDHKVMVYGTAQHTSESLAEVEAIPSVLPNRLSSASLLVARFIFQKGSNTAQIELITNQMFTPTGVANHANLSNVAWTSSAHTGTASNFAGFDGGGAAAEYPEVDYLLTDGSRVVTGSLTINPGTLFMEEQANAAADVAGQGQYWVNTATPNEPWFTNDAGADRQLLLGTGGAVTDEAVVVYNGTAGAVVKEVGVTINAVGDIVANSYDGVAAANIVDKSAAETIAGAWDLGTPSALVATNVTGIPSGAFDAAAIDGDDINSNIAGRSITLTAASPDTLDADAELYTHTKCGIIETPTSADTFLMYHVELGAQITAAHCIVEDATSATIEFEQCDVAGDNCTVITTAIVCDVGGQADDGVIDNPDLDIDDWVRMDVTATSGTPGHVTGCFTFSYDD